MMLFTQKTLEDAKLRVEIIFIITILYFNHSPPVGGTISNPMTGLCLAVDSDVKDHLKFSP